MNYLATIIPLKNIKWKPTLRMVEDGKEWGLAPQKGENR